MSRNEYSIAQWLVFTACAIDTVLVPFNFPVPYTVLHLYAAAAPSAAVAAVLTLPTGAGLDVKLNFKKY